MTVKTSISLTDAQEAFARKLVEKGQYPSLSAVLQRGLEMLRAETELHEAEVEGLRRLLDKRRKGPFISAEESQERLERLIAAKKAEYGL